MEFSGYRVNKNVNIKVQYNTIQYNKFYLKSENIKHYNTSSNFFSLCSVLFCVPDVGVTF